MPLEGGDQPEGRGIGPVRVRKFQRGGGDGDAVEIVGELVDGGNPDEHVTRGRLVFVRRHEGTPSPAEVKALEGDLGEFALDLRQIAVLGKQSEQAVLGEVQPAGVPLDARLAQEQGGVLGGVGQKRPKRGLRLRHVRGGDHAVDALERGGRGEAGRAPPPAGGRG